VRRAWVIAIVLLAVVVGCASKMSGGVVYPSITPEAGVDYGIPVSATFTFEGEPVTIDVTVDGALYEGAQTADKTVTRFGNARENDWIEDYFPAFVEEEHQDPFFDALLAELRTIRDQRHLDGDRYVELLTVFVQSIEYRTDPVDLEPKFPVETFVEGNGDCDDKTLLLAGLLTRERYDVAVLLFEDEKHVALGIRCEECDYRGTGYAYTETTAQGFVGMVPEQFSDGIELQSRPKVFKIGSGEKTYTAGDEVREILEGRKQASALVAEISTQIAEADRSLREIERTLQTRRAELDRLLAGDDKGGYRAAIPGYNELIDRYNAAIEHRNSLAEQRNSLVDVARIVVEGFDDRSGTYYIVKAVLG